MRNPNGYGSVAKLSGKRRKPFVVRKTVGWTDKGYPIYQIIGYYPTREAGMIALAEYNKSPWDIDAGKITLAELYKKWTEKKLCKMGVSSQASLKATYKHTRRMWGMKYRDIKSLHMQDTIDQCGRGYSTQKAIKALWMHLDKFALENDIITKSYSPLTTAESVPETNKKPFTDDEVDTLWKHKDDPWIDSILVFLYSGWRISELLGLKCSDVDIDARTMQGGVKTKSGKNRIVPIHSKVFTMVKNRYNEGHEYLFSLDKKKIGTKQYYKLWNQIMCAHDMNHTPHECRHTFRSRLDSAGANRVAINKIMGHSGADTGERTYTHKTIEELKAAIETITL
jgi:Site-specific recombinase XerD